MTSDEIANRINCGSIIICPDVKTIRETSVEFVDGRVVEKVDVILYATGYKVQFPFIDDKVIKVRSCSGSSSL